jgi:DNA polymerase III alpha subunit
VKKIDRPFFDRVKSLDRDAVRREISDLLTESGAMSALFRRRDAIVKAFEELAKSQGEANVFEDWPSQ